ncbi:transketolase family protein [Propionivibrio dicarboxylicus]|uniref:Transketolase n=1 Tax=Propionivibrio dicarboxylicus TaxID=83767 RepID=A0A1G8GXL7_9RHOO|nr:transketolase C-terminal domain-containing protein [Propionivibrio dicarboxylicus]SDH99138.1 transketolase [Propionivibrio dicarboxylicus]
MSLKMLPTRDGYGNGLVELGATRPEVVVLDADLAKSTRTDWFQAKYPERFFDIGIAEQDMIGTAAGLSLGGKVPFATTYAVFVAGRAWDQIRTTVCYSNLNVKIAGAHGGISAGGDGATHQSLEDVAVMRVLPNMTVILPCDAIEAKKATIAAASMHGPCYLRFAREATPVFTREDDPFEIGKAIVMKPGEDVTIIAAGPLLHEALLAHDQLAAEGVSARVINMHTVKPLDAAAVLAAAKETGAIVTVDEAQLAGGLGGAVAETLVSTVPVPVEMVGIVDTFLECGLPEELAVAYNLKAKDFVDAAKRVLKRKRGD